MLSQIAGAREVSVLRNGAKASVYIRRLYATPPGGQCPFASYRFPYVVDSIMVNSPAAQAGILPGDSIIAPERNAYLFLRFQGNDGGT